VIGFAGGVEDPQGAPGTCGQDAYEKLSQASPGDLDLLVTHEGPWGVTSNSRGEPRGSRRVSALLEALRPRYHVFGHHHEVLGPVQVNETICIRLNQLVGPPHRRPGQVVKPGSLGILEMPSGAFHFVTDRWLVDFGRRLDFQDVLQCIADDGPARQ